MADLTPAFSPLRCCVFRDADGVLEADEYGNGLPILCNAVSEGPYAGGVYLPAVLVPAALYDASAYTVLVARLAAAREAFRQMPFMRCEWLHHATADQHDAGRECPVAVRLNAIIADGTVAAVFAARALRAQP